MSRTRAGAHYANNRMFTGNPERDARYRRVDDAYRAALGVTAGEPLPRALGSVQHNRALPSPTAAL
ncbi:hypothetical protein ACFV4G_39610 [Kitasatospora sp. NPDC059747]|uniref:hypothetical protein n=1 Tax=Kitasatospora sp. NPDC059747 TaxID=3346930 RepID=UPI003658294E